MHLHHYRELPTKLFLHLNFQKQGVKTMVKERRLAVFGGWSSKYKRVAGERFLGDELIYILLRRVVTQIYKSVKIHQTVHQ